MVIVYAIKNFAIFVRDGGVDFKRLFRGLFRGKGLPISNKMRAKGKWEGLQFLVILLDKLLREFKLIFTVIANNHHISIIPVLNYYFYFILFAFFRKCPQKEAQ